MLYIYILYNIIMETDVITNTPSLADEPPKSNTIKYIVIFIILAVLGFNLFTYVGDLSKFLGHITDRIIDIFRPILAYFGYGIGETAKTTVDLTAKGSKKVINVAAGTLKGGINVLEKGLTGKNENDINNRKREKRTMPLPDEAGSTTQTYKGPRKSGFCYIGEDRGFRSCISVGEGDTCMSGNIFPSQEICINPNLREG